MAEGDCAPEGRLQDCYFTYQFLFCCSVGTQCITLISYRPFLSSLVPLFQTESKCETFHIKMSSACSFIFMQIKVIFIRMVSHLGSL